MRTDSSLPSRLGTYRLEKLLGRGGMGEVFLAWDERLERHVAIKRILSDPPPDARARARFRREARAVARLSHPAIVQIFELLETESGEGLVMEYVEGRGLTELIARGMELDLVLRLASEIADGLAAAHAKGLVHRDLKPENVRVAFADRSSARGTSADPTFAGRPKILDFGLARLLWDEGSADLPRTPLTRSGALLGTVHAMSPEQASGRAVDHRSDLFALGGLLYEMLTGQPPLRGLNTLDTLRRVISEDPVPLVERRPGLPRGLVQLVHDLLEKEPIHRPQNARLVVDALERLRASCGAVSAGPSPEDRGSETRLSEEQVSGGPLRSSEADLDPVTGAATAEAPTGEWPPAKDRPPGAPAPPPGWLPARGQALPRRPHWVLEEHLGEEKSGDFWLASHPSGEKRLFKLCLESARLPALEREVTFFRLLKEALGRRDDIVRVLDWNFDEAPFYLEAEYSEDGDLPSWAELRGGLDTLPLAARLDLVAEVCEAVAAVHSVSVLHNALDPGSILVKPDQEGRPRALLGGFEVGGGPSSPQSRPSARLYAAPEVLEGGAPTVQSDLYALGVILYQMVVGDLTRVLAPGWRRDVDDELLAGDIARIVDRSPTRRPSTALEIAGWLRGLEERRTELRARREALSTRRALARSQRRRRHLAGLAAALLIVALALAFQERRAVREAARAHHERETARRVSEFLVGLFEVADPGENPGRSFTARDLLDRGRETLPYRLEDRPELQAVLRSTLGRLYGNLGDYDVAFPLLQGAVDRLGELSGGHHLELAPSLHELAKLHFARGDHEAALALYREALALRRRSLGEEHPDVAVNLNDLGLALLAAGDAPGARAQLHEALEIHRRSFGEEHRSVAAGLHNLARVHEAEGDTETAEKLLRQALDIQRRVLGELHPDVAASLNNLGVFFYRRGDRPRAEELLREALDQKRRIFGDVHPEVAAGLNNLAVLLQDDGGGAKSRPLYEEALEMYRQLFGERHVHVGNTLVNLAMLELEHGSAVLAERLCREALAIYRQVFPAEDRRVTHAEEVLAAASGGGVPLDRAVLAPALTDPELR